MISTPQPAVWPILQFADARRMIDFLRDALGFREVLVVDDHERPELVAHAQMAWPHGGRVMFASHACARPEFRKQPGGDHGVYLVVPDDAEVDRCHARALAGGAVELMAPQDMDYGGRGSSVSDPEGNHWSFGSYRGEP